MQDVITVLLPKVSAIPSHLWGSPYTIRELLTDARGNPKLEKSDRAGTQYRTCGLTLSPARESGYQMCPSSSVGCRAACLYHQGRGQCDSVRIARIAKTVAFHTRRDQFQDLFYSELDRIGRRARREGFTPAVRLNIFSDLRWERIFPDMFVRYADYQFYDYTKIVGRMTLERFPSNYHLTFSLSEDNELDARSVLRAGRSVAVVFRGRAFPSTLWGYPVVSGEDTDLRFLDPVGVVIALYAKGMSRHDDSGFVLETDANSTRRQSLAMV